MSVIQSIRKISDIKGSIMVCNICKIALLEEYFNHVWNPLPHKPNPKTEYDFKYQLSANGKCQMGCSRYAYCSIYHEDSKYAQ